MSIGLICSRVENLDDPVRGSVIETCVDCKKEVWVDPESVIRVLGTYNTMPTIVCLQCAEGEINKIGFKEIVAETLRIGIGRKR